MDKEMIFDHKYLRFFVMLIFNLHTIYNFTSRLKSELAECIFHHDAEF